MNGAAHGGPLNVLVIHGIGDREKAFADAFEKTLNERVRGGLVLLAKGYELSDPPASDPIHCISGYWAHVTEAVERALGRRTFGGKLDFLRRFGMRFMGDVIAYRGADVYDEIHGTLADALRAHVMPGSGHVSIIAHSLGAVIASDFVYDHTLKVGRSFRDEFGASLVNIFTLGSPLALFAMQSCCGDGRAFDPEDILDRFDRPIRVESSTGVWLNLYGRGDIIGYPIKWVNRAYREAVTADLAVEVGSFLTHWTPLSHGEYWSDEDVVRPIAEKLAIDFAAINLGLEGAALHRAHADYHDRIALAHAAAAWPGDPCSPAHGAERLLPTAAPLQ